MELSRVVEVIADHGESARERWSVGSGYVVQGAVVLTAAHVVTGARELSVRFAGAEEHPAGVLAATPPEIDLTVLGLRGGPSSQRCPPYALIARDPPGRVGGSRAIGFPRFKETPGSAERRVRDPVQVEGWIPTAEGLISGSLTLRGDVTPMAEAVGSAWAGMSGAAVFARDQLVGVVVAHHLAEGAASLTVAPFDRLDRLDPASRARFWTLLGVDAPHKVPRLHADADQADARLGARLVPRLPLPPPVADFVGRDSETGQVR